jgi:transaldolase
VNVTLIFSLERYNEVMEAYLGGLEERAAAGLPLDKIASVASFFISRVDSHIDPRLQASGAPDAQALAGKAAIANARLAYARFSETFSSERFTRLKAQGARVQRPLWASTSTKNPAYRDVLYVEELIGPDTVNTVPPQTLAAFLDHGRVRESITENLDEARALFARLEELGIFMPQVTAQLEEEGVKAFADAFSLLLEVVEKRRGV